MQLSIRIKLLAGFICVAVLVVVAGVTGMVMMKRVVSQAATVIEEKVPLKDAAMEALIAVETSISESRNYLINRTGLGSIRGHIQESLARFDKEISDISSHTSGEANSLAAKAANEYPTFKNATEELMRAHDVKATYTFEHKGVEYDIKAFLYYIGIQFNEWEATLEESSKYNVPFSGSVDPAESDFGTWYPKFKTPDKKLAKRLKSFNSVNVKAHQSAKKIADAEGDKKASYYERAKSRHFNKAKKTMAKLQKYVTPVFDSLEKRERAALATMQISANSIRDTLEALEVAIDKDLEAAQNSAKSSQRSSNTILLLTILISVVVAIIIALFSAQRITSALGDAVHVADRLADGELAIEVKDGANDETGRLLRSMKHMVEKLREVICRVQSVSDNVASSSHELSASSDELSSGMTEQSSKAAQVATAATEMNQTLTEIAKNASNIAESTSSTVSVAKEGKEIVDKTVTEVREIERAVSDSSSFMTSLGERSTQIGQIVAVINDIADQTNLLALNAAIEAARAGEQGRGFAVVADEVRKLAERTTTSTTEIGEMIGAIQNETEKAIASMEESLKRVEVGAELSSQAGESLENIVTSVDGLQLMVQQIASATEEMSAASEQISADIETIASISDQTNTSTDNISNASTELAGLASELREGISHFRLEDKICSTATPAATGVVGGGATASAALMPPKGLPAKADVKTVEKDDDTELWT